MTNFSGVQYSIVEMMRLDFIPLESSQYYNKLKVIEFLRNKGVDYASVPIPASIIARAKDEYPTNWNEYFEKYSLADNYKIEQNILGIKAFLRDRV